MSQQPLLFRPFEVHAIPERGMDQRVEASVAERAAIAEAFGLIGVATLGGEATLTRRGDRVTVAGRVVADIVQACVVTLEPVPQHIDETFSLRLVPEGDATAAPPSQAEPVVDLGHEDPPDVYSGRTIDLGAIILEHVALAIDPYPRAPGAELPAPADAGDRGDSPFAVLSGLKAPRRS